MEKGKYLICTPERHGKRPFYETKENLFHQVVGNPVTFGLFFSLLFILFFQDTFSRLFLFVKNMEPTNFIIILRHNLMMKYIIK